MTELQQYYDKKQSIRTNLVLGMVIAVGSMVPTYSGHGVVGVLLLLEAFMMMALVLAGKHGGRWLTVMEYVGYDSPYPPLKEWEADLEERGEFVKFD